MRYIVFSSHTAEGKEEGEKAEGEEGEEEKEEVERENTQVSPRLFQPPVLPLPRYQR